MANSGNIKVTAIVSVYKAGRFIKGCLDDLLNQTLYKKGELEIVIINSNSPENEHEIITGYESRYDNIVYIRTEEREPIYTAWNRGVRAASGKYVTNANTDDRHREDALEVLANELDNNSGVQLVYADIYVTEKENDLFENAKGYSEVNRPEFKPDIMLTGCHMGPQPMWRKSVHEAAGYFNEAYKSAGDYEFWCRMVLMHGMKLKHVTQKLGLYLFNATGIELGNLPLSQRESANILDTYKKYIIKKSNTAGADNAPIDIVFLTWNRFKYFHQTIEHLILNTRYNYRIIIVDNKSDENFREYLRHSEILYDEIILNDTNEWTAAFQKGIEKTKSDPFIVSDPDILVPALEGKCWLERLIDLHRQNEEMGLIALNLDDSNLPPKLPDVYLGNKERHNEEITLSNVGTVMQAIKRKYVNFPYITDWETCELIRRNGGKVGFAKNIIAYHLGWNEEKDYPDYLVDKYKFFKTVYKVDTYKMNTTNEELINRMDEPVQGSNNGAVVTSIVIPVYNQADYTKITLNSILETAPNNTEIILIDNASTETIDDFVDIVKQLGVNIRLIKNETNLGFPKAVNQGLMEAKGKYVVVANNDIILNPGWLDRFIETAEMAENIGIVSGISNNVSGVQKDLNATYQSIDDMKKYAAEAADKFAGKAIEFPRVAFICTLIKREVISKIGGLDERYTPGNYEDDDFCLRNQIAGYKSVICKDVFIHHFGSKSFKAGGDKKYDDILTKSKNKFVAKWGSDPDGIWLRNEDYTNRDPEYPIDKNEIHRFVKRANLHISAGEYELGLENLNLCIEAFKRHGVQEEAGLKLTTIEELTAKIRHSVETIG